MPYPADPPTNVKDADDVSAAGLYWVCVNCGAQVYPPSPCELCGGEYVDTEWDAWGTGWTER